MKKAYIDEDKKIIVDICPVGHGIWFDGGEVQSLVKEMVDKSPKKARFSWFNVFRRRHV